jgi:hypothetical protein
MPMTLSGDGTITGLVAGGLPNATVIDADLSLTANSAQVMVALNASGSAPIYACRAWVNFNGTGTVAIRASGNVSSITDNSTGNYTVNFTTAMPDANYAFTSTSMGGTYLSGTVTGVSTIGILIRRGDNDAAIDSSDVYVAIFR